MQTALRPLRKLGGALRRHWHAWVDGSEPVPFYFKLELSRRCNLRCLHCGVWQQAPAAEAMPLERWLGIVSEIGRWAAPCHLSITSGEPLLAEPLFAVLAAARREGLRVSLVSNGTLIGRSEARQLRDIGVRTLILSLDGVSAATHDLGRGLPGAHARVLQALDCIAQEDFSGRTQLQTIIAGHNLAELGGLVRLARERGLEGIRFQALQPRGEGWQDLWPKDPEAVSRAIAELLDLQAGGFPVLNPPGQLEVLRTYFRDPEAALPGVSCRAAETLYVGARGEVYACRSMEPLGDACQASLREIWRSPATRTRLTDIRRCRRACILLNCNYRES